MGSPIAPDWLAGTKGPFPFPRLGQGLEESLWGRGPVSEGAFDSMPRIYEEK